MPSRTLCISSDKCKNGKFSKERITIGLCCNLDGTDKLRPIVIGKSAKPRCFGKIKSESLPVVWRANEKAWMTLNLFQEWLSSYNHRLLHENRRILLFVDNSSTHNITNSSDLKNVELIFLPPNTTSLLQPLDLCII